jgi:SagB-type dehydrogenase family enzyme
MHLRAAASGGGLHPAEIYPVILNVEGMAPGLYHYSVRDHALSELEVGPCQDALLGALTDPRPASSSAVTFVLTAVMPRNLSKYLFRGYRFLSYDQGCLLANFYLTTTALGLAACAIGGFYDDAVGAFLDVDNVHECVMMLLSVGHATPGPLALKHTEPLAY